MWQLCNRDNHVWKGKTACQVGVSKRQTQGQVGVERGGEQSKGDGEQ